MSVYQILDLSRYDLPQLTELVNEKIITGREVVESGRLNELLNKWSAKYQWMMSVKMEVIEEEYCPTEPCCTWGCEVCEPTLILKEG